MNEELENKYASLLVNRCLDLSRSNSLFINYYSDNKSLVEKITELAKNKGITDIYLAEDSIYEKHKHLEQTIEQIKKDKYFDSKIWDAYAKKKSAFLMLSTEFPEFFDDINPQNISAASLKIRTTKPLYKKLQLTNDISWCIAVMPNKIWAKAKFPELDEDEAYNKLFNLMMEATMVTKKDPIKEWNNLLKKQAKIVSKLNKLEIKELHYKNKLGTDLIIGLPEKALWQCAGYGDNLIVNMPTYELFTSPDYRYTNGIVYASKPLMYGGALIDKFWIKFKDGKVVDFDAKVGKEILKGIIESDNTSCFLGEVALVSKDTAIAKMNFVFGETCLDENASCHLALGDSFPECIVDGFNMSNDERHKKGLNQSSNHVDFMIGTNDLNITAKTKKGEKLIFKDGKFNI